MSGRPFELVLDGEVSYCVAFETERERRAVLSGDLAPLAHVILAPQSVKESAARARGRPSFDPILAAALESLQLNSKHSLAERARAVQKHLAVSSPASQIPSRRTVENFLAAAPARRNSRSKLRKKSDRVKLA